MSQTTILDSSFTQPNPTDEPKDLLADLVGEGKKYKTVEDLAKAKLHADKHIETILAEKRELEDKYNATLASAKTVDDLLAALDKKPEPPSTVQVPPIKTENMTPEQIKEMVAAELQATSAKAQAEAVKQQVLTKLSETFGSLDAAKSAIASYAGGNSTKLTALDALLVADFDDAVKLIKSKSDGASFSDPVTSTKRVTSPTTPAGLTWSKCEEIRKSNPKLYRSREFQVTMHNAATTNPNFMKA